MSTPTDQTSISLSSFCADFQYGINKAVHNRLMTIFAHKSRYPSQGEILFTPPELVREVADDIAAFYDTRIRLSCSAGGGWRPFDRRENHAEQIALETAWKATKPESVLFVAREALVANDLKVKVEFMEPTA